MEKQREGDSSHEKRGRRETVEERQIGKQGEGNRKNEEEEGGSDGEKRAAWRTKRGERRSRRKEKR